MLRNLILLFLCSFFSFLKAQTVTLNWDGEASLDFGMQTKILPHFSNEGFTFENGVVALNYKIKSISLLKATNLQWQPITEKELFDVSKYDVQEDEKANSSQYEKEGESYVSIQIQALKREGKNLFRLRSFNVTPENKTSQRLFTQKLQESENPLNEGTFYKIKVDKSGIFKITTQFLKANGIDPKQINPKNFRIYGNGGLMLPEFNQDNYYRSLQEDAIFVKGEADGVWNDDDFAIFYAQGPDGFNLYKSGIGNTSTKRTETRTSTSLNFKNIYENYAYYFINFDKGPGKRVLTEDSALPLSLKTRYDDYQVLNDDKTNLLKIGRIFLGDYFNTDKTLSFTTKTPLSASDVITYNVQLAPYQFQGNSFKININTLAESTYNIGSRSGDYLLTNYNGKISGLTGTNISFNISPNIGANPNGLLYLNYVEIVYKQDLVFNGSQLNFRDFSLDQNTLYGFSISNSEKIDAVWDVSDVTTPKNKTNKGSAGAFNFGYLANNPDFSNEFVAFNYGAALEPKFVSRIENQNLSGLSNIDYLIIAPSEFLGQAQRLADYHKNFNNYTVAVVDVNKIFNEFSSGSEDVTAIRNFITRLNTSNGHLKYVLMLGDGSFDYKGILYPNSNVLTTYESEYSQDFISSFVTDDYFGMTAPQTSANIQNILPNVPVGRLPAANSSEAKLMIDKTLAHYNGLPNQSTPFGDWRMNLDFVVDDDLQNENPPSGIAFHTAANEAIANNFEKPNTDKAAYHVRKLYLDAFPAVNSAGGQTYPQVNQAISTDINNSLFLFYFGHGGINGWAQERVLGSNDVKNFNNYNAVYSRFPLISTITCEFTLWDDPATSSVGEKLIKLNTGGAATMITSSRAVGVNYGLNFTKIFLDSVFKLQNDDFRNLGDVLLDAKIGTGPNADHFKVNFLGDPAMKLSRPKKTLVIDNINSPIAGQLRALDFVTITGHVNKTDGSPDKTFNGKLSINIFDKRVAKKTLNNDGYLIPILNYTEETSPIVKTSGTVVNGIFTAKFYVPKDINYTVGTGRILAYADNKKYDVFANEFYKIGDINPDGLKDSTPPKVRLFMNNTNFADGGITNQNPTLLACVTDDSGINSTGAGIGHDITAILDGQVINTIVLNDFYFSGEGNGCTDKNLEDYQKGNVSYPFRNLTPGPHQLVFKIWDINNNSTTETLNFIVKDESHQNLIVKKLLNWPNPFTDKTYIQFEHNCDDILEVNAQIYTITGKLVKTLHTQVTAEPFFQGFRTPRTAIEWDGTDDFGDTVAKGVYIYKIFVRSENQDKCKGSATAVEKMVLLK